MPINKESMLLIDSFVTNEIWPAGISVINHFGGIIGGEEPSKYSKSPVLWNRFFELCGIQGIFTPLDLPLRSRLREFLTILLTLPECVDVTITSPYKNDAYQCLNELDIHGYKFELTEAVQNLQCLNHLIPDPKTKTVYVDNTDGKGMFLALKKRKRIEGALVLLVGAGGAAASIGYEIVKAGAELQIANIIEKDALILGEKLASFTKEGGSVTAGGWEQIKKWAPLADIIISAITVSTPISAKEIDSIKPDCLCVDTRYGKNAEFVTIAKYAGRPFIDGKEMLFGQFELAAVKAGRILGIEPLWVKNSLNTIREAFLREDENA